MVYEWNVSLFSAKYIAFKDKFVAQTDENRVVNRKAAKKDGQRGENVGHHRLPVVAPTGVWHVCSLFPTPLRFDASLGPWFLTRFGHGGMFWASLAIFFDPLGPQNAENKQNHA